MTKIFYILNQDKDFIYDIIKKGDFEIAEAIDNIEDSLSQINNFLPDIILIDNTIENFEFVLRQVKAASKNQNTRIILLLNNDIQEDILNLADSILEYPTKENILLSTINSNLKVKKSLDRLYENNKELSRSLYQLNVLYNTSSQFAGTLNTNSLYDIMIEAMEKTLSFDISCVLIFDSMGHSILNLNTIYMPSENLVDALKIRSVLNYKTIFDDGKLPHQKDFDEIELIQKVKQTRSNQIYGIDSLSFDSLFAPIRVGQDFFGVVELFRKIPFSKEDVTCFQAITHQVALPLRSAKLYEEISITNKKLEKLEKLKSEFVSIVSHELRTPLTPINNSLEIVLSEQAGKISDDAKNFISMAKRNIQRLSAIIEDLLDLSRIQTGKLDFKYKMADITPSLELLQKTFNQVAKEKNIKINFSTQGILPQIYADTRRIEQIFTNLVSNSLKFTPPNGEINVSAKVISSDEIDVQKLIMPTIKPNGSYIQVSVEDNGIGINEEDIPKIFDKFSQIESSLNRNKGGIGLGLTITKQLIDSHLGAIWVKSVVKEGSSFNVLLPLPNEIKIFEMDLSHALINHDDVGIIKISYDKNLNLINILKEKNILTLSKLSQELFVSKEDKIDYYVSIPKISTESFYALLDMLSENINKIKEENKVYDIILSKAHSKKDGSDINKILKILNTWRRDEKDFNSR